MNADHLELCASEGSAALRVPLHRSLNAHAVRTVR